MRLVKARNFLESVGEHFRPKTREERRAQLLWSGVVLAGLLIAWGWYFFTTV